MVYWQKKQRQSQWNQSLHRAYCHAPAVLKQRRVITPLHDSIKSRFWIKRCAVFSVALASFPSRQRKTLVLVLATEWMSDPHPFIHGKPDSQWDSSSLRNNKGGDSCWKENLSTWFCMSRRCAIPCAGWTGQGQPQLSPSPLQMVSFLPSLLAV